MNDIRAAGAAIEKQVRSMAALPAALSDAARAIANTALDEAGKHHLLAHSISREGLAAQVRAVLAEQTAGMADDDAAALLDVRGERCAALARDLAALTVSRCEAAEARRASEGTGVVRWSNMNAGGDAESE